MMIRSQSLIAVLFLTSAIINVGLGHKVATLREAMSHAAGDRHEHVIGAKISSLELSDLSGHASVLQFDNASQPTLLYVFRTTCGWCRRNLPNIQALQDSAASRNYRVVGIALDDGNIGAYVVHEHIRFPVFQNVSAGDRIRLAMGGTPQTLVVANHTVVRDWDGAYSTEMQKEIEDTLKVKLPGTTSN